MSNNLKEEHWTRGAKCDFDPSIHFSYIKKEQDKLFVKCVTCPVKKECKDWVEQIDGHFNAHGTTRYDRLLSKWKRVKDLNGSNF